MFVTVELKLLDTRGPAGAHSMDFLHQSLVPIIMDI